MASITQLAMELNTEVPEVVFTKTAEIFAPVAAVFQDAEVFVRAEAAKHIPAVVEAVDKFVAKNGNVHSKGFPLMDPFDVVVIVLAYFLTLIVLRIAMSVLPSPKNLTLFKGFQLAHNVFLTALSAYMSWEIVRQAIVNKYNVWGNGLDNSPAGRGMAKILWIFYVSKVYEFLDTIIMVLRKSYKQVSFLHVYHHASIFPIWWLVVYMGPTGDSYFSAALNSFVHVIMYSYYMLATFGITAPWKYYITMFQMFQFALNFWQAAYIVWIAIPEYPTLLAHVLLVYMVTLLMLFYNFYTKSIKEAKAKKSKEQAAKKKKKKN